jgi:phosphatidylinositol alpha-mannosyltransferase
LNIAVFAPYDLARPGGVASHIRAQARALRALGHSVSVFGPASAALPDGQVALSRSVRITVQGTSSGVSINPLVGRRISRLFASERFDIVHVHEPLMPLLPWFAVTASRAPVVATFHVCRERGHRFYPLASPLLRRIMRRVDARIAVSDAARRTVARHFPGNYEIIPNGIESARFRDPAPRPATVPDGAIVLCVGRLERRKGVAALIEAMAIVRQQVADAALVIVGDGPDRARLRQRAQVLGVRALFATAVGDDELPAYYQAAHVVCAPALEGESFGIVLLEALAAERPVIASRIAGYSETVAPSSCVRFVAPGDAVAIAGQIIDLVRDRRMTWRAEAARIASAFEWSRVAERIVSVYRRVHREPSVPEAPHW